MEQKKKTKKLNILYRVIPLVCSLAIAFIGIMPIKAYAAQFPITDYQTSVEEYTTFTLVNYSFPENLVRWSGYQDHAGVANIIQQGGYQFHLSQDQVVYDKYDLDGQYYSDFQVDVLFRPQGNNFISTDGLGGGVFTYSYYANPYFYNVSPSQWTTSICYIQVNMTIRYFNSAFSEVGNRQYTGVVYRQNYNHITLPSSFPNVKVDLSCELNVPAEAVYFQPYVYTRFFFSGYSFSSVSSEPVPWLVLKSNSGSMKILKSSDGPSLDGLGELVDQNNDMINQNQQIIGGQNTIIDQNQQMLGNQNTIKDQNQQIIGNQGIEQSQNQQIIGNQNVIKDQNNQMIQNQQTGNEKLDDINTQLEGIGTSVGDGLFQIGQQNDLLISGSPSDKNKVNESLQGFQQSDKTLDQLTDDLKVNQPSIDPEDVAVENIVDAAMMPIFTAPFMQLWDSPVIVTILTVVLTLVMISFVFFGKKG